MAEEAGKAALYLSLSGGSFKFIISANNVQVATELIKRADCLLNSAGSFAKSASGLALGGLTLGFLYKRYREPIDRAIKRWLGYPRSDQDTPVAESGSLHVLLHCKTDKRFLEVLDDFESKNMIKRLENELTQIGIIVDGLSVAIENMEEVTKTKSVIVERRMSKDKKVENTAKDAAKAENSVENKENELASKEKDLKQAQSLYGEDHEEVARCYYDIADLQLGIKNYNSALDSFERCLQIYEKLYGEDHPDVAQCYYCIGVTYYSMKDYQTSLEFNQRALKIRLKGESQEDIAKSYHNIGALQHALKYYKSALISNQEALKIRMELHGENHKDTAASYNSVGLAQSMLSDYDSALKSFNDALKVRVKLNGEDHLDTAVCYHNIGVTLRAKAEGYMKKAIDIKSKLSEENQADSVQLDTNELTSAFCAL